MQRSSVISISCLTACLFCFLGCGASEDIPPNFKTTVTINYKGQPAESAMVTLRPDGHKAPSATGVTGDDGKVQLFSYKGKGKGVMPGKYLVAVEKQTIEAVKMIDSEDPNYGVDADEKETQKERADLLPAKYISAADSGLTCTVTEDASANVFEFDLVD